MLDMPKLGTSMQEQLHLIKEVI